MSEIDRLQSHHFRMIELALAGCSNNEISRLCEMSPSRVSIVMRSGLFQDELARRRSEQNRVIDQTQAGTIAEAKNVLDEATLLAAQTHITIMQTASDLKTRQLSASEILKRTFDRVHGVGQGVASQPVQLNINQLQILQLALRESRELDTPPLGGPESEALPKQNQDELAA